MGRFVWLFVFGKHSVPGGTITLANGYFCQIKVLAIAHIVTIKHPHQKKQTTQYKKKQQQTKQTKANRTENPRAQGNKLLPWSKYIFLHFSSKMGL